jgi:hypothetical protein
MWFAIEERCTNAAFLNGDADMPRQFTDLASQYVD